MGDPTIPVFINRGGGAAAAAGDELAKQVAEAFAAAGVTADVQLVEAREIAGAVRKASETSRRLVVGGGDGTMGCVAQALADRPEVELAILPLGTLNHLARDLAIPSQLEEAAALAVNGTAIPVDVALVNDHRFVNNASVGLYPFMVRRRDDARERTGLPKWLATLPAAWAALSRLPHHRLRIDTGQGERPLVTSLLFIGNNRYALEAGSVGTRDSVADGLLSIFAVARRTRLGLIWFALRTLVGRADRNADFVAIGESETLTVHSSGDSIEIALDGEVRRLPSPLHFRVDPGKLKIVAPGQG
ncbi:MAG: hypothetical protein JOY90_27570 [Bradyrhizobium sp.]|uniref:diacylglycerol/lipid kinase family protein n=1 Tax=Bradyrhizobium sp. TaxID=376 RepID=UPI001D8CE3C1|nr:diacylglycerol kinase family protein [Bradyrhizobium sp.]MBV9564172.1 hypothetical protein [Bradyrhizobium sp.]